MKHRPAGHDGIGFHRSRLLAYTRIHASEISVSFKGAGPLIANKESGAGATSNQADVQGTLKGHASSHVILILTLCSFALGCSQQFIMGIPSVIAASCDTTLAHVGQLMTAFSVASALGAPVLLARMSHVTQRNQLIVGLILLAAGMTVMASTSNYAVLIVTRIVMGLGSGLYCACAMALASRLAPPGKQASALANMGLGSSAAQIIAMPLAQRICIYIDWHILYAFLAAYVLVSCLLVAQRVPSSLEEIEHDGSLRARFAPLHNPLILRALIVMVLLNVGYSSYYTYVTPFLENVFGEGSATVSLVLLVSAFMSAVGIKAGGFLTDHKGFQLTCRVVLIMQMVTLAGLSLLHSNPVGIWVFMCLWVMADWGFNPSQNLLITKLAGKDAPMALALSGSALQLGNAIGSALGGAFITVAPIWALPLLSSACIVATFILEVGLLRQLPKKGRNASEQPRKHKTE